MLIRSLRSVYGKLKVVVGRYVGRLEDEHQMAWCESLFVQHWLVSCDPRGCIARVLVVLWENEDGPGGVLGILSNLCGVGGATPQLRGGCVRGTVWDE